MTPAAPAGAQNLIIPATERYGALAPRAAQAEPPVDPQYRQEGNQKQGAKDNRFDQQPDQRSDRPLAPMCAEPFARLGPRGDRKAHTDGSATCQQQNKARIT